MTPDQPEKQPSPCEGRQRSRSYTMTPESEFIDLTGEGEHEAGSSRKHDRNDEDTQLEGSSKRPKMNMDSEPPMSKDKSMTPKAKRKKLRKNVDHRKAPRTSNHQKLKADVQALDKDLKDARQKHHDDKQELKEFKEKIKSFEVELDNSKRAHEATQQKLEESKQESTDAIEYLQNELSSSRKAHDATKEELIDAKQQLKSKEERLQKTATQLEDAHSICEAKTEEVRKQQRTMETEHEELQRLKALADDPVNGLQALQELCQKKDDELKSRDDCIAALEKKLEDSRSESASLECAIAETKAELRTAVSNQNNYRDELVKTTNKLGSAEQDLDEAKTAREEAEKDAEALHRVNEAHGHRTQGARNREQKAKETLKSERNEKSKLEAHCTKLEASLKDQKNEHNQTVASLQQKLVASRNQSQRYNYKEPDEKIKKDFASLEARIRQFVDNCAKPVLSATDEELKNLWPGWSPGLRDFLASPFLCNLVFEAYVWEYLMVRIFAPGSEIWTGELGRSLDKTLRLAGGEISKLGFKTDLYVDFQYLRSSSSSFIHHLNGEDFRPKYFTSDVEAITSTLAKLCGCDITGTMKADMMEIFKEARELEIQLRMLKAVYGFLTCKVVLGSDDLEKLKHGFDFFDGHMVDRSPKRSSMSPEQTLSVDFITCPGLYKRGNNSGGNYDIKTCLIKMGVVCNAKELLTGPILFNSPEPSSKQAQEATHSNGAKPVGDGNVSASTTRKAKKASASTDYVNLKDDEADEQHPTATPPAVTTRNRGPPKINNTPHGWKPSAPSAPNTRGSARGGKGRGAGTPGKKARGGKFPDPDAEFDPAHGAGI